MNPKLTTGRDGSKFWVDADSGLPLPFYRPESLPTELTPIGEQFVIPGCEKDRKRGPAQFNLWDQPQKSGER